MGLLPSRDGSYTILKSMTDKLISDFNHNRIPHLTERPIITRTVTDRTPEPYIYFYEVDSDETWVSTDSESRVHNIMAQVMVRDLPGRGSTETRDHIANEVILQLTDQTDYPDASEGGFLVQRVVTGNIVKQAVNERGAKYYIANIPIEVTATYAGYGTDATPSANASLTYSGWEFDPVSDKVEDHDSGTITVATSGYSASNGWDVTSVSVAKQAGKTDGTLSTNVLTVGADDDSLGLTTTFSWRSQTDNTETTTTTDTDSFARIKSLRYGSITSSSQPVLTDDSAATTGLRNFDNWNIDFGNTNVNNDEINITVTAGQYIYIIFDDDEDDLDGITENVFNQNILDLFDKTVVGGYKIYLSKNKSSFAATYTYTLSN